jgi:glycosyltransferase involved in cell wall biosynthesis
LRILHIDLGKEHRGGQRQSIFLHNELLKRDVLSFYLCNKYGIISTYQIDNKFILPFKNELDIGSYAKFYGILKQIKPDIIHSHDSHSLSLATAAKFMLKNVKVIHTRRLDISVNKTFFSRLKYKSTSIDMFVAISEAVKRQLINDGIDDDKVQVIYSSVYFPDLSSLKLQKAKNMTIFQYRLQNKKVVCHIGSFTEQKDHITLLKAFEELYNKRKDVVLFVVGTGKLFETVVEFAKKLKSFDNIIFTGFKEDIYPFLLISDLFVVTSIFEGLCSTIIDAMYCGVPVVATNVGGVPELVENNVNGFLCEVRNYHDISEKMDVILSSDTIKQRFSSSAHKKSLNFSVGRMANQYIELYQKL